MRLEACYTTPGAKYIKHIQQHAILTHIGTARVADGTDHLTTLHTPEFTSFAATQMSLVLITDAQDVAHTDQELTITPSNY